VNYQTRFFVTAPVTTGWRQTKNYHYQIEIRITNRYQHLCAKNTTFVIKDSKHNMHHVASIIVY